MAVVPTIDIVASDSEVFGCAPRAVSRIDDSGSIAAVLNGSSFVSTMYRAECPSGEMKSCAAFLKSSEVSTLLGMYMPAMEGDDAPCFIDNSRSDAWFRPAPIFLVWSTSVCTPAASRALPSASWLAPLCTREISDWMPAAPPPVAARRLLIAVSNWPLKLSTADSTFGTAGAYEAPAGTTCPSSELP